MAIQFMDIIKMRYKRGFVFPELLNNIKKMLNFDKVSRSASLTQHEYVAVLSYRNKDLDQWFSNFL